MENLSIRKSQIRDIFFKPIFVQKTKNKENQSNQNQLDFIDNFYNNPQSNKYIIINHTNQENPEIKNKLNPNLETIKLQAAIDQGITGKDIVVAVVDSGIIYNHPDIERDRIILYKDFSNESNQDNPKDTLGHGTYVSSIIGGTGVASNGYNRGIAPGTKFIILRITSVSEIIKALEWLKENGKKYNVKVINLSIGVDTDPKKSWIQDTIAKLANDLAQEFTVVAAAGNDQTYETIDSPGVAPDVITVGGSDTKNTPETDDDTIYIGSSKGPTPTLEKLDKPDVIAPSKKIAGARVPNSIFDPYINKNNNQFTKTESKPDIWEKGYYIESSGTSAGTAIVSGLAALLYEILPNSSPQLIKKIITQTATKLKDQNGQEYDKYSQGNGLINIEKAIQMALNIKNNPHLT